MRRQHGFDLPVAVGDLVLVMVPALQGLAQREDVLGVPSAAQGFEHLLGLGAADLHIAQRQQRLRRALSRHDGAHHRQSAHARQRADDVVQLDVHALQRLLHVLHAGAGAGDVVRSRSSRFSAWRNSMTIS